MKKYSYTKEVNLTFDIAIDTLESELLKEWFWVLSRIDIKSKINEKLWKYFDDYMVLGACNPELAYQTLQNEIEIWLLLPCNVIVYKKNWKIFISTILPTTAMEIVNNHNIYNIVTIAEEKLKRAIDAV